MCSQQDKKPSENTGKEQKIPQGLAVGAEILGILEGLGGKQQFPPGSGSNSQTFPARLGLGFMECGVVGRIGVSKTPGSSQKIKQKNPGEGARMNSGITRGGLSQNSRRRSQIQVPEPSGKGGGWKIPGFYFLPSFTLLDLKSHKKKLKKQKKVGIVVALKRGFLGWGFLGMLVFSIAIALQKKPEK